MSDNEIILIDGPVTVITTEAEPDVLVVDNDSVVTLTQTDVDVTLVDQPQVLILESNGGTGPQGPAGPAGAAGSTKLFIQPTAPVTAEPSYLWVQTYIGGDPTDFTMWIEVGP